MKKIKLTFPYPDWPIERQLPGQNYIQGDFEFYINQDIQDCDYWVVFNSLLKPQEKVICPPENTIFIAGEPFPVLRYNPSFVGQFHHVITCQRELEHPNKHYISQAHPWFIERSYDELLAENNSKKTKNISVITSNKLFTEGHRKRYDFVMKLKDHFGDEMDLFGRGVNDFKLKREVLEPYKYSIAIENCQTPDYFSEKIIDCFLAHTYPFYVGCTNLKEYFNPASFQVLDMQDLSGSIQVIERVLQEKDHYQKHLADLVTAKVKYLNTYNIFPLIINFIQEHIKEKNLVSKEINLVQKHFNISFLTKQIVRKIYPGLISKIRS